MFYWHINNSYCIQQYQLDLNMQHVDLIRRNFEEYKHIIKLQTKKWLENINNAELVIMKMPNEKLGTSKPKAKFNIIDAQITLVNDHFSHKHAEDIIIICANILKDDQFLLFDMSHVNDPKLLCTYINDYLSMSNYCDITFVFANSDSHLQNQLSKLSHEVSAKYLEMARITTMHLAQIIIDKFFTNIDVKANIGTTSLVTPLQYYLNDLSRWLDNKYYNMLVKKLMSPI